MPDIGDRVVIGSRLYRAEGNTCARCGGSGEITIRCPNCRGASLGEGPLDTPYASTSTGGGTEAILSMPNEVARARKKIARLRRGESLRGTGDRLTDAQRFIAASRQRAQDAERERLRRLFPDAPQRRSRHARTGLF